MSDCLLNLQNYILLLFTAAKILIFVFSVKINYTNEIRTSAVKTASKKVSKELLTLGFFGGTEKDFTSTAFVMWWLLTLALTQLQSSSN